MRSFHIIILFAALSLSFNACKKTSKDIVLDSFAKKILQLGFKIDSVKMPDEMFLSKESLQFKVNISNLRKQYAVSPHEKTLNDFVELVINYKQAMPSWSEAKKQIFYYLYPSNYDFKHFVHETVSPKLSKIYVFSDNGKLEWISNEDLTKWGISALELEKLAQLNSKEIYSSLRIELDTLEGHRYISIESNRPSFNSSFVLCSQFKDIISTEIGWPVYAIVPCRDQIYIFGEKDLTYMKSKLKNFVQKKHTESNDPLSLEILQISDEGIKQAYEF